MPDTRRDFLTAATAATVGAAAAMAPLERASAARAAARAVTGHVKLKDGTELFDCWDQHAVALVDAGFRVISYDRRGFGRSTQPAGGYNYNQFADDLAEVIAATGAKDATLVGFSMGGGEIARYLSRHGTRNVIKVGLVATILPGLAKGPNNPNGVEPAFFEGLKNNLRKDRLTFYGGLLRDVFYDVETSRKSTNPISQAVIDWSVQQAMQAGLLALIESVEAFGKEDFWPDLAAVTMPTLIVHGSADKPVPFDLTARRAARGIRGAKLIEYAGATHGLLVSERERLARDLIEFVSG